MCACPSWARTGRPSTSILRMNCNRRRRSKLASWLDGYTLDQLQGLQYARSETLEVLEVDVPVKKAKERDEDNNDSDPFNLFGSSGDNYWALKEIGINMSAQIAEGRFRKTYRRDDVVEDVMQTLAAARNSSVLLVGPSETGKTAIVHEIIRRIQRKDCPDALFDREVWLLSPDRIIAGAQYIGTWEERITNIVDECRKKQHILYVEDLPGLLEVGRWSKSDANVGQALRPHLASGEVTILGESLPERATMGDNLGPSFMNVFRRVEVPPMSEEEALAVLGNVARDFEREYNLRIVPDANSTSVGLTRRFVPYRAFPGKAIRLVEEASATAARNRPTPRGAERSRSLLFRRRHTIVDRQSVLTTFARVSGMPEFIVNDMARMDVEEVAKYFHKRILGQEGAVSTVVNLIATVKAGMNDPEKPLGTFLFIGPTGVGKTQMAKTIASYLFGDAERLIRFDMSEYRDYDGVARLIGAFGNEGELTKKVREQPFSVVLLDEFEKADSRIYDVFLQVLGEGRLTDSGGRTTYFHNAIIIMTSNLGADAKSFGGLGFGIGNEAAQAAEVDSALQEHYRGKVEEYFRPEFVNRLDHVVVFGQLDPLALRNIASREMGEILLRDGITRRNLMVEIEDNVIDLVLEEGYSPLYGARPLKRAIERLVVSPMARELAGRSAQDTNLLRIGVDRESGQLALKSVPIDEANAAGTNVELRTGLTDSSVKKLRMDTAQLVEGYAMLRRKLADWLDSETFEEMQNEKQELLTDTQSVNFWDDGEDARAKLSRFYFLDRLVRRVHQLYEKAEYLEDFAVLVNKERDLRYQPDLARDYEELHRNISYLDIELRTAHLPHRNQAMLLLRPMGMTPNQRQGSPQKAWVRRLSRMYLEWAERKGYDRDLYILIGDKELNEERQFQRLTAGNFRDLMKRFDDAPHTDEIALMFEGSNIFGFLKGERGLHRLELDPQGDELVQVLVFAIPDGTNVEDWLSDYREIKVEIEDGRRPPPPLEKLTVIRVYSLDKGQGERFIRDIRTNVRTVQIKDVMEKGQLDDFILAFLEQEEAAGTWEDRFPPTFPY